MSFNRIHEEAFAVERVHFKKTKRGVSPKKVDPFLVMDGTAPLLVSAPHAVRTLREGTIKASDEFTGSYAFLLHREAGCHVIATKKLYGGDPNWDAPCIYKDRVREIVERHSIRLVLDLHGAARERPFDVDLGTMHGESLLGNQLVRDLIVDVFHAEGIDGVTENRFAAAKQQTVTRFCAEELHIPAVQFEINHRFRAPNRNGADYVRMFRALAAIVDKVQSAL